MNNDNKVDCFLTYMDGDLYVIPQEHRDNFDTVDFYDRKKVFSSYLVGDDMILESILVDDCDLQSITEGEFG